MFSRLPLTALVVLVLLAIAFLLHDSDEDAILSQLQRLREQAAITEPESGIEQLARANSIADGFSESTVFDLTSAGYGTTTIPTRQELVRQIIAVRNRLSALEIDLQQTQVQVDGDTARVLATGSGLGSRTGQQGEFLEIHSGVITLVREHGEWLITGATHLRDERQPER
jgi:hypothetical protein